MQYPYNPNPLRSSGSDDLDSSNLLYWLLMLIFLAILLWAYPIGPSMSCDAKTRDIGYAHRWGFVTGCQIEVNPGQWIPLESFYFRQE